MWTWATDMEIGCMKKIWRNSFSKYCLLKNKLFKFFKELIWVLSEFEAIFSEPNDKIFFRKIYLKLNNVSFENPIFIGRNFRIANSGNLTIGKRCAFGDNVMISNNGPIFIGNDFLGASGLHINSGGHDIESLKPISKKILIGSRVWCGINVTILSGVQIGSDVVIGANSLICKDIPAMVVAMGQPAKPVKSLKRDNLGEIWTWVD